ncbi:unnamed protein product, partial [Closterium sp. Naga37s-1]
PGKSFNLDALYDETDNSRTIFGKEIERRLSSLSDGYSLTVLVYGASGSGKTYLMQGDGDDVPGVVSLCAAWIAANQLEREGYQVSFSYSELYGNKVFDLLHPQQLEIMEDSDHVFQIPGLHEEEFGSLDSFLAAFSRAKGRRHLAATEVNAVSSRSHAILQFNVSRDDNPGIVGRLKLVDLAGREQNKETGNTGQRMTESCDINLSLSALSRVIEQLNDPGAKHVSYRGSNLTKVLQDSLGGSSRGVMIACLAPNDDKLAMAVLEVAAQSRLIRNNVTKTVLPATPKQTVADRRSQLSAFKAKKAASKAIVPSSAAGPSSFSAQKGYIPYPARVPREQQVAGELHRILDPTRFKRSPIRATSAANSTPSLIPRPRSSLLTRRPGDFLKYAAEALENDLAQEEPDFTAAAVAVAEAASASASASASVGAGAERGAGVGGRRMRIAEKMTASMAAKMVSASEARQALALKRSMAKHQSPKRAAAARQRGMVKQSSSVSHAKPAGKAAAQPSGKVAGNAAGKAGGEATERAARIPQRQGSSGTAAAADAIVQAAASRAADELQRQRSHDGVVAAVSAAAAAASVAAAAATAAGSPLAPNAQQAHFLFMDTLRQHRDGGVLAAGVGGAPDGAGAGAAEEDGVSGESGGMEGSEQGSVESGEALSFAAPGGRLSDGEVVGEGEGEVEGEDEGTSEREGEVTPRRKLWECYRDNAAAASDTFEASTCHDSSNGSTTGSSSGSGEEVSTADQDSAESKEDVETGRMELNEVVTEEEECHVAVEEDDLSDQERGEGMGQVQEEGGDVVGIEGAGCGETSSEQVEGGGEVEGEEEVDGGVGVEPGEETESGEKVEGAEEVEEGCVEEEELGDGAGCGAVAFSLVPVAGESIAEEGEEEQGEGEGAQEENVQDQGAEAGDQAVAEAELVRKLNTATEEELMEMKGIGPRFASRIRTFRDTPGAGATPFQAFTDLTRAGISSKL